MQEHLFIETINRHRGAIEHVCRAFCHNADDLEDLRQEVLLGLWRAWKQHRPYNPTVTWVWRITSNCCIGWYRKRKHQVETVALPNYDLPTDETVRLQCEQLDELIAMLPIADQRLIGLYLDGWTAREIGVMMAISESNVTTRISRIKQKLKKMNIQ